MPVKERSQLDDVGRAFDDRQWATPGPAKCDSEQRNARRRTSNGMAFARIPGYRMRLACRVVNVSATGACLSFFNMNTYHLPDRIVLTFRDHTEIDIEIRWRKGRECGVRFRSFFRPVDAHPPTEAQPD